MSRLLRLYEKKRGHRRTGSTKLGSLGESLFFSVFLLLGIVSLSWILLTVVWPEWRANRQFVETPCKVLETSIASKNDDGRETYRPEIKIEYQVAQKRYFATTYDAAGTYYSNEQEAAAELDKFKVGKQYSCWYDPMDPQRAVLVRGYSGLFYVLLLVPLSFLAIGGGGLAYTLLHWGTSAERRTSLTQRANLNFLKSSMDTTPSYPNVPEATDLKNSPGTKLAYRLPIATSPGWALFGILLACLFWNGITSVFVFIAVKSHVAGKPEWFLTLFIIPFVLIGLAMIYFLGRQFLITTGIGPTKIEISHHPLQPGEACELLVAQAGRLNLNALEVLLVCAEKATFRQGTDTRTETKSVFEEKVFVRENFTIDPALPLEEICALKIPPHAMHSFRSEHNEVQWKIIVKGNVAGWPDYQREYPIIVYPPYIEEGTQ